MPESFSPLFIPCAIAVVIAFLALAFARLHPALPEKRTRLGGFTWWLLVALCLGGTAQSFIVWRDSGVLPWTLLFWSCMFGIGAAGMWVTAHSHGEQRSSAPAGLKNIGRAFGEGPRKNT